MESTITRSHSPLPTTHRQPPSPSPSHHTYSIGLPPSLPHSPYMGAGTPKRDRTSLKRGRTPTRSGEVSSCTSAASDSEDDNDTVMSPRVRSDDIATTPTKTPRRKIVNAMEAPLPRSAKRRETLQERLNAAAASNTTTRRSTMAAGSSIPVPASRATAPSTAPSVASKASSVASTTSSNDKVVVCMRIKPTQSSFAQTAYELTPTSLSLSDSHPNVVRRGGKTAGREAETTFQFDTLVQFPTRTPQLYADKVAPLVEKAMKGFNSTVFAYGQTGSGKSHTMSGTPSELGIIPCAIDGIFDAITADMDRAFLLRVSYIEIYNETLRDLLNFKKGPLADSERPTIRTAKGKIHVEPLVEEIVSCPEDVVHLLEKGNNNRRTGATDWNERSSRSHAVFTITIESRPREGAESASEVRVSRLTLIDLAGSEKAVSDADRRGEGKHINRSLLALREVVHKLTEKGKGKPTHIPYRDSKLTHLLENVLGGDSNICVICTMSAQQEHCAETLETLKFAGRCSQVTTKAQKNILQSSEQAVIRAKDMEIAELKRQLEELAQNARPSEGAVMELADELAEMTARKERLAKDLALLNSQILTSELPASGANFAVGATPRKRRARISDVSVHSSASQFLGLGTPRKTIDRRAVSQHSSVLRLEESDAEMDQQEVLMDNLEAKQTDYGIAMSLRHTITEKEAEIARQAELLEAARAEAAELPSLKSALNNAKSALETEREEHLNKIRDLEAELESTRAEHAQAVVDKTEEIERLESKVLEYCKDREDALVDDEERFDKVSKELAVVKKERDEHVAELAKLRQVHADAVAKLEAERDAAIAEQGKVAAQLAELQAALDRESEASTALRAEKDQMAADLEGLRADRDKVSSQLENFQRAALDRESEVVSTLRADLVKERETKTKTLSELEKMRQRLSDIEEAKRLTLTEMSEQLATILTERETAQMGLKAATAAKEAADKALKEALDEAKAREKQLADSLATVTATKDELNTENERSKAQVELLTRQLKDKEAAHGESVREIEALRAGADVAQSIRAELDTHRGLLEAEKKERAAIAAAHADIKAKADTLATQLAAAQSATEAEAKAHAATTAKLESTAATVAGLQKTLEGAQQGHVELQSKAAAELRSADEKRKAEVASIRKELDGMKASLADVTSALEAERKGATDTAKLTAEIEVLKKELAARPAADEVTKLRAELEAARASAAQVAGLKKELQDARSAAQKASKATDELAAVKKELESAKRDNSSLRVRNDKLASDLAIATSLPVSPIKKRGHSSTSSFPNAVPPTTASCPGHEAEIDRLDKVVTMQKGIIEEQRVKIQYWSNELEKQKEVVRILTESGLSPATVTEPLPSIEAASAVSVSTKTAPSSPTPARSPARSSAGTGSKHARASIPNKGLGLFAPPSPLPMHPTQVSNARKARRITIEHDMDRLQEGGRVNLIKTKFDSPEKPKGEPIKRAPRESRVVRGEGLRRM